MTRPVGTDNPAAFPVNAANLGSAGAYPAEPGMSLRDWFAGQALIGLITADDEITYQSAAEYAYAHADALLLARKEDGQ